MCGFVGVISNYSSSVEKLKEALNIISYRGPDSSGIHQDKNVKLGFNRLSIQDISDAGDQPMESACKRYIIVFNGEIYNYNEIRKVLDKSNQSFQWKSTGDTEVLLECIKFKGLEETLKIIEGMFSFALWDKLKNKIYLCRDHFGQKPLFYTTENFEGEKSILLASEAKAFIPYKQKLKVDLKKAYPSLFLTGMPLEGSIFKGVKSVPPGTYIEINVDTISIEYVNEYFHPSSLVDENRYIYYSKNSLNDLTYELDHLMNYSVKKHCISDVELGLLFSTGVDSNLITTYLSNDKQKSLYHASSSSTNLLGSPEKIASFNNLNLVSLNVDEPNPIYQLPKLLWSYEEPNKMEGLILAKLCKLSRLDGIKVLLSGCAADELFGGYSNFSGMCWNQRINQISKFIPISFIFDKLFSTDAIANGFLEHYNLYSPTSLSVITPLLAYSLKGDQLNNNFSRAMQSYSFISPNLERYSNSFLLDEISSRLPRFLLRNDRFSMMESIELRVPYLDQKIVSFAVNISALRRGNPFSLNHRKKGKRLIRKLIKEKYKGRFSMQNFAKKGPSFNCEKQLDLATRSCEFHHLSNLLGISRESIAKLIGIDAYESSFSTRMKYSFLSFELIMMMYESSMSINEVENYLFELI